MSRRLLIYGDVNLNYRDGSGAWLIALANCLLRTGSEVHVLLKADVDDPSKLAGIETLPDGHLHPPQVGSKSGLAGMTPNVAAARIAELDVQLHFDLVITRGSDIAAELALAGQFTGRMWPYLTEGPAFSFDRTLGEEQVLARIAQESRRIFVQTEEARSIVESLNGGMSQKILVMNPIVPDEAFREKPVADTAGALSMVYAGKFARLWNTLEMTELPARLQAEGVEAHLHMIGDKFQNTGNDHDWLAEMRGRSEVADERITWHGGLPRSQVLDLVYQADIGMCWRNGELDSSPEISTKMLECAALGTPPILNRTAMHERLLGADYPLFVDRGNPLPVLKQAASDRTIIERARQVASDAVRDYSAAATATRFASYFERSEGVSYQGATTPDRKHRVVVAGHDFKFAADLIETLKQRKDLELRIDKWRKLSDHDRNESLEAAEWADTVICEWAGPNAVFYSQHLSSEKRLLVRFHGFEVRGQWLDNLQMERVDAFVFVSDFYRKEVIEKLGWPENKTTVIPNTIDVADLDRPKVADARFHIGMAGYVPFLKRPDRAVELLRNLLHVDERFHLHIRGRAPWRYQWEWEKAPGRDAYEAFFASIARDPLVRDHVTFEPFLPDMGNWFRGIGWMVSPSTRETFHLAPIEGMASGAPALVWDRDGADEIFGADLVHSNIDEIAKYVIDNSTDERWAALSQDAKKRAEQYDIVHSRQRWFDLLDLPVGEAPPLYGTSILGDRGVPTSRAQALVRFNREFHEGGVPAALAVYEAFPDWLESEQSTIGRWRRINHWIEETEKPHVSWAPLYLPVPKKILVAGALAPGLPRNHQVVVAETPKPTGNPVDDIVLAIDAFTRRAIRERVDGIAVSGDITDVFAAHYAARRLGISCYADSIQPIRTAGTMGDLLRQLRENLERIVVPISEIGATGAVKSNVQFGKSLDEVTIGIIADEFTRKTIAATVSTVNVSRHSWRTELGGLDALIVESAWEGRDKEWFHGVAYHGEDEAESLWGIIDECRRRNIPVLFWNKEDPVHFRSFKLAASKTDYVFTTDANMIPEYLQASKANNMVSSMPFFVQPSIHNPMRGGREPSNTVAFAGSYYGDRYPKRSEELRMILGVASGFGLTIYDRQKDLPNSPYQLPEELQSFSVGSVPYEQMGDVYKAHPVHINVNSVSDSPTMFSRRVVEIAASGSLVASGAGKGVGEVLGAAFPELRTREDWQENLGLWFKNEQARLDAVWDQLRTVMRSYRADQALCLMLRTAGIAVDPWRAPQVGWMVSTKKHLDWAEAQSLQPAVITNDEKLVEDAIQRGLQVLDSTDGVEWIGKPSRGLSPNYLEDLLTALHFVDADVLSARTAGALGSPIIDRGLGDPETALWQSGLSNPSEGSNQWVWRF